MMTDPIADMLTRIRNGVGARKASVDVPWSKLKQELARVLAAEGYLDAATVVDEKPRRTLRIGLRYDARRRPVITGIRRESRPSLRVYVSVDEIPAVRKGFGHQRPVDRRAASWSTATRGARRWAAKYSAASGNEPCHVSEDFPSRCPTAPSSW